MFERNTVVNTGVSGLVFTDENGKSFFIDSKKLLVGSNERVLFSRGIERVCCNKEISDREREIIISKVLELTPEIKWRVQ